MLLFMKNVNECPKNISLWNILKKYLYIRKNFDFLAVFYIYIKMVSDFFLNGPLMNILKVPVSQILFFYWRF